MRAQASLVSCLTAAAVVAGCSAGLPGRFASFNEAFREPAEQVFGPDYPASRPAGSPTRIDAAELSADRQTLTVRFIGGPAYLASDPCSTDFEPELRADRQ